jgi:hypothetical protein
MLNKLPQFQIDLIDKYTRKLQYHTINITKLFELDKDLAMRVLIRSGYSREQILDFADINRAYDSRGSKSMSLLFRKTNEITNRLDIK